jgi:AcrR family transcriptional regulator
VSKGQHTRQQILDVAFDQASRLGLEGLTIGKLAEAMEMSKSGVFAHFKAREELQLAVIDHATQIFLATVFHPALAFPRGLPRLRAIVENWFARMDSGSKRGCVFLSGAWEYDDRPGPLREALADCQRRWRGDLALCVTHAIEKGQLNSATDPYQVAFEIFALVTALHHDVRLLDEEHSRGRARAAFERLLAAHGAQMVAH